MKRDTRAWIEALRSAGVSACPVQFREQLIEDEQARANGLFVELEHDLVGRYTVVAPPVRFSETELRAGGGSPPLGRDTEALLLEAGLDHATIDRLAREEAIYRAR